MSVSPAACDAPVLSYLSPDPDWRGELAFRCSCIVTGIVTFSVVTAFMIIAALRFHAPDLYGIYPLAFGFAVIAAMSQEKWTRFVGIGAVAGSVLTSTIGYAAGLLLMAAP